MRKINQGVYFTGILNPNLRVFDVIMKTDYGTTYNSYLVCGSEKTAVIEASHARYAEPFLKNISGILGDKSPDYLILNHTEPDHSGSVALFLQKYPDTTIVASQAAAIYLKNIVNDPNLKIKVVKDNETLSLGDKTLRFINAPFLHWADSMFTWAEEDGILFSCDFFGSHYCEPLIFDENIAYPTQYETALKYYYDCIFGPFAPYVQKGLEKVKSLDIKTVCPSHGPVLTDKCRLSYVKEKYAEWSAPAPARANKLIPIFYCTAYGNTRKIAEAVRDGILKVYPTAEATLYNVIEHDLAALGALLNASDAFLLGTLTINREIVPPISNLISTIDAVNIVKRPVALFGSFGWSGEGFPHVAERLASLKCAVFDEQFKINFVPTEDDLSKATDFGEKFAKII
jgi:flavorubredoxin